MPEALAPAKINLFLHVGPPRDDGYHPLCSLMEKVSLFDRLLLEPEDTPGLNLSGSGIPLPENTVIKAASLLAEKTATRFGAQVKLEKNIPVAAGLAGGSTDAAAALRLLLSTFGVKVSEAELGELALEIGADVPFFLKPGPQLAEGIGEVLTLVSLPFDYAAVIVTPLAEISTRTVYRLYDEVCAEQAATFPRRCRLAKEGLAALKNPGDLASILYNDLEAPAATICQVIPDIKKELLDLGALGSLMSGSGPSVFGLFEAEKSAQDAARKLSHFHPRVWVVKPFRQFVDKLQ